MIKDLNTFVKNNWDKILLILFILTYILVLGSLSISRHDSFSSNFDLSNMDHTMWNTLFGNFFSLRFHDNYVSRLSVHADFILILLSPIYLFWDNVRALLLSQTIFLALGALPTYLISVRLLRNKIISLCIVVVYLLNPGMMWTNIYDFHPVALTVPFFLFAFYFALLKKWFWYFFFIFLVFLTKENQSLNIAVLGLAIVFVFKNRLVGAATISLGIIWFALMVFVVMPKFSPNGTHWAITEFQSDSSPSLMKINIQPMQALQAVVLDQKSLDYYILLLKQFSFAPLLGLPWLVLAAPSIVINVLRDTRNINLHYDTSIIPALTIATIYGFYYLNWGLKKIKGLKNHSKKITYLLSSLMVLISLRVNYHYSPLPTTPSCWCQVYNVTKEDKEFERTLQAIPKDASITASLEIRPHINHRDKVWFVPSATESAQYIALITENRIIGNSESKKFENNLIPILSSSKNFTMVYKSEHFYLFKRSLNDSHTIPLTNLGE